MPRKPVNSMRKLPNGRWEVYQGRSHGQRGKRSTFKTKVQAKAKLNELNLEKQLLGIRSEHELSTEERYEYLECKRVLEPYGFSLKQVVSSFLKGECNLGTKPITVEHAIDSLIQSKQHANRRTDTVKSYVKHLAPYREMFANVLLNSLSTEEVMAHVQQGQPRPTTQHNRLRYLSYVYNYAIGQGWVERNPIKPLFKDLPSKKRKDKSFFLSPEQVKAILKEAEISDNYYEPKSGRKVPYVWLQAALALMFYAGIRPSEAAELQWKEINFDERTINLPAIGKTGVRRYIKQLSKMDALWHYLDKAKDAPKDLTVMQGRRSELKFDRVKETLNVVSWLPPEERDLKWIQDTPRHTAATFMVEGVISGHPLFKNWKVDTVRKVLGHKKGSDTLEDHYEGVVTNSDWVKDFYELHKVVP